MNNFFLKILNPEISNHSLKIKTLNLIRSYLFSFVLILVVVFVIIFPLDLLITDYLHFESVKYLIHKTQLEYKSYPFYLVVFIGPFAEELLFRLALKVNKFNIAIFFCIFTYLILGGSITKFDIHKTIFLYYILISIILSILSYFYFPEKVITLLNKKKNWLIIISIALFGLVHISNIKTLYWQLALLYPFFVLPQMIMGYFITNLRLKYGFFWGFLLHILINSSSFLF